MLTVGNEARGVRLYLEGRDGSSLIGGGDTGHGDQRAKVTGIVFVLSLPFTWCLQMCEDGQA